MGQQVHIHNIGQGIPRADLLVQALDGAVDDGIDVRLEKAPDMVPSHRFEGAQADGAVFLQVAEQLQKPFLPEQRALVLLEQDHGLVLQHPAQQVIDILKMVVEALPADPAHPRQFGDRDLVHGLLGHQHFQRRGQLLLGLFGNREVLFDQFHAPTF